MKSGNCNLCGTLSNLTFEHIPPRVTFNRDTRYRVVSYLDVLTQMDPFNAKQKGKIYQGGVGYHALCSKCNSFLGQKYVPEYNRYSNSFIDIAKRNASNYFQIEMHQFEPLKVLKQIAAMFICTNGWEFSQSHRDLANFVLNPDMSQLDSRYRFFNYLNTEGQLRNLPLFLKGRLDTDEMIEASEIAFPPLGHVLTLDFSGTLPTHFEISGFANANPNEKKDVTMKVFRLPTHIPMLLDYRNKETIEKSIKRLD